MSSPFHDKQTFSSIPQHVDIIFKQTYRKQFFHFIFQMIYFHNQIRNKWIFRFAFHLAISVLTNNYFRFSPQRALSFLNNDGSLRHNSVSIWSVFVNSAGEWKLGGLEFVQSVDNNNQHNITLIPVKIPPALEIYVSDLSDLIRDEKTQIFVCISRIHQKRAIAPSWKTQLNGILNQIDNDIKYLSIAFLPVRLICGV